MHVVDEALGEEAAYDVVAASDADVLTAGCFPAAASASTGTTLRKWKGLTLLR